MTSSFAEQLGFGAGVLVIKRVGTATPIRFGVLQEASPEFSSDVKMLYGGNRYAVAQAGGKTTASVKAKYAGFNGTQLNEVYFGGTLTDVGRPRFANNELILGGGGGASVANAGAFLADAGVIVKWSGRPLYGFDPAVVGATGDYTVAGGAYSFGGANFTAADQNPDTGAVDLYISYVYTDATGKKLVFGNPLMGSQPVFSAYVNAEFDGRSGLWFFPRCVTKKLTFATKLDDFTMNDFEFDIVSDISDSLGELYVDL
jgi:hypothetical protein